MENWGYVKKCQNYRFFDISWDILDKIKGNLDQERAKKDFYPSRAKVEQLPMISLEK